MHTTNRDLVRLLRISTRTVTGLEKMPMHRYLTPAENLILVQSNKNLWMKQHGSVASQHFVCIVYKARRWVISYRSLPWRYRRADKARRDKVARFRFILVQRPDQVASIRVYLREKILCKVSFIVNSRCCSAFHAQKSLPKASEEQSVKYYSKNIACNWIISNFWKIQYFLWYSPLLWCASRGKNGISSRPMQKS